MLLLYGCNSDEDNTLSTIQYIYPSSTVDLQSAAFLIEETSFDFDQDEKLEKIKLFVTPAPKQLADGSYAYDDSHTWQLLVEHENEQYVLYDANPHFAKIKFWLYKDDASLALFLDGNTQQLIQFTYDNQKKAYKVQMLFNSDIADYRFRSSRLY